MNFATNKCPVRRNENRTESQLFRNAMDILCQRRGNECFYKLDIAGNGAELEMIKLHDTTPYIGLFQETQNMHGGFNDLVNTVKLPQVWIHGPCLSRNFADSPSSRASSPSSRVPLDPRKGRPTSRSQSQSHIPLTQVRSPGFQHQVLSIICCRLRQLRGCHYVRWHPLIFARGCTMLDNNTNLGDW
jgi:hypothetical protein